MEAVVPGILDLIDLFFPFSPLLLYIFMNLFFGSRIRQIFSDSNIGINNFFIVEQFIMTTNSSFDFITVFEIQGRILFCSWSRLLIFLFLLFLLKMFEISYKIDFCSQNSYFLLEIRSITEMLLLQ